MSDSKPSTNTADSVKGISIASLVLGIVGVVTCWTGLFSILGFVCAIIGLILAVKARKVAKTGLSTAGFVLSIIGTCLGGIGIICAICVLASGAALLDAAATYTYTY